MIAVLVALLLPTGAMWLLLRAFRLHSPGARALDAAIAFCAGTGVASLGTFAWVLSGGRLDRSFAAMDALLWISVGAAAWRLERARAAEAPSAPRRPASWIVRGVFAAVAALAIGAAVGDYLSAPHGHGDATLIWNLKARFMLRGGVDWSSFVHVPWSSPSHPLLVPASVARLWAYAGSELPLAPVMLGAAVAAAVVAALIGALDARLARAWVAASVAVAPWTFSQAVTAQTADLPMALFLLVTVIVVMREWWSTADAAGNAHLVLAGVLAAFALWTKNEGVVVFLIALAVVTRRAMRQRRVETLVTFVVAAAPVLAAIAWLKLSLAPVAPEYLGDPDLPFAQRSLLDPARVAVVASLAWEHVWRWGGYGATGLLPVMAGASVAVALAPAGWLARRVLPVLAIAFGAFCAVWMLTPLDPAWLVSTTADRLLLQLWPSLVLAAFAAPLPWVTAEGNLVR